MDAVVRNPSHRLPTVPLKQQTRIFSLSASSSQSPTVSDAQTHNRTQIPPSNVEGPNVSTTARIICEILAKTPPQEVVTALSSVGVQPVPNVVEEVLSLLYGSPSAAVNFFRWAGVTHKHSERAWNIMVDLLGKNQMFDSMWDAIRSMRPERVLSIATFVSVFESYCRANKFSDAIMSFNVMEKYETQPDVIAVNSLLSAICREGNQTCKAYEFLDKIKTKISPDADSYAILLEGWEKEGNLAKAKTTFGEMVITVGWSPRYMSAYDAFLSTLVRGSQKEEAVKFLQVMKTKNCMPGLKFFSNALDILVEQNDPLHLIPLWETMVDGGLMPNLTMYNAVIGLLCNNNDIEKAFRFLDEMVFFGAFPNSSTYNSIFRCLIKNKKFREVGKFFIEMTKNECPPTHLNCAAAISLLFECDDPEMAVEIWDYMVENHVHPLEDSANALLVGFCRISRLTDVRRFAYKMIYSNVKIYESTMGKLESAFSKGGRNANETYDDLLRKLKSSEML